MRTDIFEENNGVRTYSLQKIFGRGYNNILWINFKGRYRFVVGSRASKKSQNLLGYEPILRILENDKVNIMMIRQNDVDNKNSSYANLVSCIEDLGLTDRFTFRTQPLEIEYKETHQKIIFKGMNNSTSITSTKFVHGILAAVYLEEFYEIQSYDDFLKLDGSLRADKETSKEIPLQITGVMNPWSPDHWVFTQFFRGRLEPTEEYMETHMWADHYDRDFIGPFGRGLALMQNNWKVNEFLDREVWGDSAAEMKKRSPELYKPNFLGMFGNTAGLAYPEFTEANCVGIQYVLDNFEFSEFAIGIDTGLSSGEGKKITIKKNEDPELKIRSATTMCLVGVTRGYNKIVLIDEYFHSNDYSSNFVNTDNRESLTHPQLLEACMNKIVEWMKKYGNRNNNGVLMKGTINCFIDSADISTRQGLEMMSRQFGIYNVRFSASTKISIQSRVDFERLMLAYGDFLICKETCPNAIREFKSARKGEKGEARAPGNDHLLDAESYAWQPVRNNIVRWKTQFKEH